MSRIGSVIERKLASLLPLPLSLALLLEPAPAAAAQAAGRAKLTASDGEQADNFGNSVSIDGATIVVGAWLADDHGVAYVFVGPDGWEGRPTETAKLEASDPGFSDFFGHSVAISGDTIVVGAYGVEGRGFDNRGAAYVFEKPPGGWAGHVTESARLTASDAGLGDDFGVAVAISGDTILVGAVQANVGGHNDQGAAYVFVKPGGGWSGHLTEDAKLTASDGSAGDQFGDSVSIDGDTVVVGAHFHDVGGHSDRGAAYVFVEPAGGWAGSLTETAELTASDGAAGDAFGSVAVEGDTVLVGAPGHDGTGLIDRGSAYVFVEPAGGWAGGLTENAELTASDGDSGDRFGHGVTVSRSRLAVGAGQDRVGSDRHQGSAYLFSEPPGGWAGDLTESAKLVAPDGTALDSFGFSLALSGHTLVAGALFDSIGQNYSQGSAYVFEESLR